MSLVLEPVVVEREVILGIARFLLLPRQRRDRQSYVAQYLSLAILAIGLTTLLGTDDLLDAFSCGTSFAWDGFFEINKQTEESIFSSVIDILFNVAAFIFVGAWNAIYDTFLIKCVIYLLVRRFIIDESSTRWFI